MELGKYIKSEGKKPMDYPVERRCLQCGKELENRGEPIYYQRFCSKTCKERYIGMPLDE